MGDTSISAEALLNYFPDSLLDELSVEHKVDYQVKKLEGKLVFKWLLYGVLSSTELSLNILMNIFDSLEFKSFAGVNSNLTTRRNSLSDRLSSINVKFIEGIFAHCQTLAEKHSVLKKSHQVLGYNLNRFDSTLVSISSKLLSEEIGFYSGKKTKEGIHAIKKIKFSIGFDGLSVKSVDLYTQPSHNAEDTSLGQSIKDIICKDDEVIVVDRGIRSRATYQRLDEQNKHFLVRVNDDVSFEVVSALAQPKELTQNGLELIDYQTVYLKSMKAVQVPLKLARFKVLSTGKLLHLVSNIDNLDAFELATMYSRRWDIEVFFRFLKQEMGFSHLISRNENGIKVMSMIILIAAMLVLLYKHINQLKGYKIPKMKFANELNTMIIKEIIIRCNGDPDLLEKLI